MRESELPDPIHTFIDATNAGDSDAFVAAFTEDAYLSDGGREFHGRDGVRSWNSSDNIGVQAHFDFVDATRGDTPDSYVVTLTVSGGGYHGTGPMQFQLHDGLIQRVVIS